MKASLQPALTLRMTLRRRFDLANVRSHSRFVQWTKWVLPSLAVALLLLIAVWPRLEAAFDHVRFGTPHIDMSEARQLRMVQPRYNGIDRDNQPYTLTANTATQASHDSGVVSLDRPRADMTTKNGNWVELSGDTGTYQTKPQLLHLRGHVELYQDRGNEFHTSSAQIDFRNGIAEGHEPIRGQGPFGHVTAQGFTMYRQGNVIVFNGKTHLSLLPRPKAVE